MNSESRLSRRTILAGTAAAACAYGLPEARAQQPPARRREKALIAISLDLEMARNFPTWSSTHWDYEKGNLNDETKAYAREAGRRVKARGGIVHFFLVARALEQENVDWLKELVHEGHRIGNHTYDHVYLRATSVADIQYRFKRAPWLAEGRTPAEVIRDNVRLASAAIKTRLGIDPAGFRAPGGFADGLSNSPDVRTMLRELGFTWVSTRYPAHAIGEVGHAPTPQVLQRIASARADAQPFAYPDGLVEVPMSPVSDIGAFRNSRWKFDDFLKTVRLGVEWAIENGAVFDFLSHPAVLYTMDPEFEAIEMICDLVRKSDGRAAIVDLETIAHSL